MISGKKDVHKLGLSNNPTTSIPMKNRKQATNGHISSSLTSSLGSSSSVVSKLVNLIKPQIPHLQIRITLASWGSVGMRGDKEKKNLQEGPSKCPFHLYSHSNPFHRLSQNRSKGLKQKPTQFSLKPASKGSLSTGSLFL